MLGLIVMFTAGVSVVLLAYAVHHLTSVARDPLLSLPFQSGWEPSEHALSRYHARWYVATLVFLAFDVEMLFMYPWAVVVLERGASSVVEMFAFLGALLVAVVWAWREGALRWA
ncbi:MAG: NADH-quinone oxidoreductase subunit A [Ornithinimicrobium sp.]